jgi:hypothetical protein
MLLENHSYNVLSIAQMYAYDLGAHHAQSKHCPLHCHRSGHKTIRGPFAAEALGHRTGEWPRVTQWS